MRLLDLCRSCGVAVPEQIAVLGVDNDEVLCSVSFPPLSSIDPNSSRIGYEAAALLDRMMAGEPLEENAVWVQPGQVVARQSTDILAIDDPEAALAVRFIREHACQGIACTIPQTLRYMYDPSARNLWYNPRYSASVSHRLFARAAIPESANYR